MGLGRSVATSAGIFRSNNPSRGHQRAGVKTFFPYKTAKTPPIDCSRRADSNKMADGRVRSFFLHALRVGKRASLRWICCMGSPAAPPDAVRCCFLAHRSCQTASPPARQTGRFRSLHLLSNKKRQHRRHGRSLIKGNERDLH